MNAIPSISLPEQGTAARRMLNKVPEVTIFFWIIKILATTVGETASDYLNETLGFGLHNTIAVMGVALIAMLVVQFRTNRYIPWVYWLTVVLISSDDSRSHSDGARQDEPMAAARSRMVMKSL